MNPLKALIQKLPGGKEFTERLSYRRRQRKLRKIGNAEERFTHIYNKNKWNDGESRSGAGSSAETTANIRTVMPALLGDLNVQTLLDAPCGDYNWFRMIERDENTRYIGGDIVQPLIDANNANFADATTDFIHLDITKDELPAADLWLCRDCLIHLSYADVAKAVENFLRSDIPLWLVTTHTEIERNIDIPTGHCRMINLEIAPFNFGSPMRYVEDTDHSGTGKCLGLWDKASLADAIRLS